MNMKKILFVLVLGLLFSSCNKCKECSDGDPWTVGGSSANDNLQTFGDEILEVCRDNFESKDDFNSWIEYLEESGYECKSDFWN